MAHCQVTKFDIILKLDQGNTRLEITVPTGAEANKNIFQRKITLPRPQIISKSNFSNKVPGTQSVITEREGKICI